MFLRNMLTSWRLAAQNFTDSVAYPNVLLFSDVRSSSVRAGLVAQPFLKVTGKLPDRTLDRPCRRIAEWTKRFALDVVTYIEHQLSVLGSSATRGDAVEYLDEPISSFSARSTPAA